MGFWELFALALGLSADAFAVAAAQGTLNAGARKRQAALIALFFGAFQAVMPVLGYFLGRAFGGYVERFSTWIAAALLLGVGLKMLLEAARSRKEKRGEAAAVERAPKERAPKERAPAPLSIPALSAMAVATSLDAFAHVAGFALVDAQMWTSASLIGAVTFVCSFCGVLLGKKAGAALGNRAEIFGGCVLILLAVKIAIDYFYLR
jgi:putative Mn2+ efflux pump MntP